METQGSGQLGERFVFVSPIVERWLGSFEDVERELRHVEFGDAPTVYREASIVHLAVHDLVGITDDGAGGSWQNGTDTPTQPGASVGGAAGSQENTRDNARMGRSALRRVHALSRGIPRRINLLCDRALLGAYAAGQREVGEEMHRQFNVRRRHDFAQRVQQSVQPGILRQQRGEGG